MQTFLPYSSFTQSAQALDYRRLGKQRVEAKQLILALTQPKYGWKNHPAAKNSLMPFFEGFWSDPIDLPYVWPVNEE